MTEITFVTRNQIKLKIAQGAFETRGVKIIQEKLEVPEIQAFESEEVAIFSAKFAANSLNKPIIINDIANYIPSLNGFPGAFIKYINQWLTAQDILKLMAGKTDRRLIVKDIMAYCEPNCEPILFVGERVAQIMEQESGVGTCGFDSITIHQGFEKTLANYALEEMIDYWSKNLENYHDCAKFVKAL